MSHTSQDDFITKTKDTKNINDDDKYKKDTSKHPDSNESVDNLESSDALCNDGIINTTK